MSMVIEQWPIDRVIPYSKNPRTISESAIAKVAASLKEYGWRQPIVVDSKGVIIVGHTRHAASRQLGMTEVPVHVATDLTLAQIKAYRLADNRTAQATSWAEDLLALELTDLKALDFDLSKTGFSSMDLENLFGDPVEDPAAAWEGMPEYQHEDQRSEHRIIVHFASADDLQDFAKLIGQPLTEKTKWIWHPQVERADFTDKRYAAEPDDAA
jgi:ParB-like chromosome segregation protein Spo0J